MRLNTDYMELDSLIAKVQETLPDNEKLTRNEVKRFEAIFVRLAEVSNNGWISVKDRLPEEGKFVLVTGDLYPNKHDGGTMAVSKRCDVTYWSGFGRTGDITHWMPLPEPPKEG